MNINFVKNIISRLICWILLLQMINISIDPPDLMPLRTAPVSHEEDLSINETESVYELISEGVFETNVPDQDDSDMDRESQTFDLYCCKPIFTTRPFLDLPIEHFSLYRNNLSFDYTEPSFPPPKHA